MPAKKNTKKPVKKVAVKRNPIKKTDKQGNTTQISRQAQNVVVNVHTGKSTTAKKTVAKSAGKNRLSVTPAPTIIYQTATTAPNVPFYPPTAPIVSSQSEPEIIPIPIVSAFEKSRTVQNRPTDSGMSINTVGPIKNKIPDYKPIPVLVNKVEQPNIIYKSPPSSIPIVMPSRRKLPDDDSETIQIPAEIPEYKVDYSPDPKTFYTSTEQSFKMPESSSVLPAPEIITNQEIFGRKVRVRKFKKSKTPKGDVPTDIPIENPSVETPLTPLPLEGLKSPPPPSGSIILKPSPSLPKERTRKTPVGSREDLRERFYKQTSTEWEDMKKSRKTTIDNAFLRQAVADLESGRKTKKEVLQEINDRKAGVAR